MSGCSPMTPSKEVIQLNGTPHELGNTKSSEEEITEEIETSSFKAWYDEREFRQNIRNGQAFFNGPGRIKSARSHSPSQLLECRRKAIYKRHKAPKEQEPPRGTFWYGSRVEEDLVMPFLEDSIGHEERYVTNSVWVDYLEDTVSGKIRIRGSTDPVIVDSEANPILPFEIKTTQSLEGKEEPSERHVAQLHAYLRGLSEDRDQSIDTGCLMYVAKENFNAKQFVIQFDSAFWEDRVLPWVADVTAYQLADELPPADPENHWECSYCDYSDRCGEGDRMIEDQPPTGLLPLQQYPRGEVVNHLEIHEDVKMTPTLAHHYPDLVDQYGVYDWQCRGCDASFSWDTIKPAPEKAPQCPDCEQNGSTRYLSGPKPSARSGVME